jgi:U3 small nucleolar RNA-associated protein 5
MLDDENEKPLTQITLQQLLTQGIASEDIELLERAFQITDKKIINATVKRMNPAMIVKLLDHCVARLQKTPGRAALLVEWIRSCLLHHSGYLLSVPELTTRLASLYKTLEKRSETHTKLLKLSGRLDMVVSQMETFEKQDGEGEEYVFDAEGESEEEVEDQEDFEDEFEGFDDDDVIMDSD